MTEQGERWSAPDGPPPNPAPGPPGPPGPPPWGVPGGGAPQGGYASPGWPPGPPPGRNGFAVAALVLGILPVMAGLLAIVFGLIGRSQARRTGQRGATMATVGAALGAAWLLLAVGVGVWSVATGAARDDTGAVVDAGDASAFELVVGDCLETVTEGAEIAAVPLVPCASPHDGEVYAAFDLPDGDYPGEQEAARLAESGCIDRFSAFVGLPYEQSVQELFYLHPTKRSWVLAQDRSVVCLVLGEDTVGSARGSRR